MKNVLFILTTILILSACQNGTQKDFQLDGAIAGADGKTYVLAKVENRNFVGLDTATVTEEKLQFNGSLDYPQTLYLVEEGQQRPAFQFFAENSKMKLVASIDSLNKAVVTGSSMQDLMTSYGESMKQFDAQNKQLSDRYREAQTAGDEVTMEAIYAEYEVMHQEQLAETGKFISANASSAVALSLIQSNFMMEEFAALQTEFNKLDTALSLIPVYNEIKDRIAILDMVQVGKTAPDFTLTSIDGEEIALSSFKGKYLLLDFWASWCGPCRAENPNVSEAYSTYQSKGFEVLSVSVDRDMAAWKQAVEEDNMVWTQLHDSKDVSHKLYGVMGIPHTILLDQEGVILAKNVRGKAIQEKLAELLN